MKKILLFFGIVILFTWITNAQQINHFCYTDEHYHDLVNANPEILKVQAQLEEFTKQYTLQQARQKQAPATVPYVIPIVVHVLHNYGPEDITDAQILDGIRIWNQDYQKLNADTVSIVSSFKALSASCGVEFRLATIDPNGNCTNGIDRIATLLTYNADDNSKLNPWPYNKYLNVWVCGTIGVSGAAAYATFPGTATTKDGIMILNTYFGSIGTGTPVRSRVLTHESGHCFNLQHCWGNNNNAGVTCGDDGVSDTPVTKGWNNVCDLSGSICNPPIIENVQNFMEYSYCCNMFTNGQKTRLTAALNSSLGSRNNLWTSANLIATGTADGTAASLCIPVADFNTAKTLVCQHTSIQFKDYSWKGKVTSWQWTCPGGNPYISTDSLPTITYDTVGTFNVTLKASNSTGSNSITRTAYITVIRDTQYVLPAIESFESATFPPTDGFVLNPDKDGTWARTTLGASLGSASMRVVCYTGNVSGHIDEYITPAYNLANIGSPTMTFDVAYAEHDTSKKEALKLYYTFNCGDNWTLRYSKSGTTLATAPATTLSFVPTSAQWRKETVNISGAAQKSQVRFKFQSTSAGGNNIYVDNINISGTYLGIDNPAMTTGNLTVYPNPATGQVNVMLNLSKAATVKAELLDILGNNIFTFNNDLLPEGKTLLLFNTEEQHLLSGIYLVKVSGENISELRKLVVN